MQGMTALPHSSAAPDSGAPIDPDVDFYTVENFCPEDFVGYTMRRAVGYLTQDIERQMGVYGLTDAQWKPLLRLLLGQANTVAELARGCSMDAGSMTRLLDRIEAKGLVRRIRSSEDRRVVNIELTAEGREAAAHIPRILAGVHNTMLRGFSEQEWRDLQGLMNRILNNVQTPASGMDDL